MISRTPQHRKGDFKMPVCQQQPVFRYTWPGRDEVFSCSEHAQWLSTVAEAMGLCLQLIPLSPSEQLEDTCFHSIRKASPLHLSLREELAKYAHTAWSGWMRYLFEKSEQNVDGTVTIPAWAVERWQRQASTLYQTLSGEEKESDRQEADKMISIMFAPHRSG